MHMTPRYNHQHPPLILISGPSGAGEDSVIEAIVARFHAVRVVTTVTRKPRPEEQEGEDYYFISIADFKKKIAQNAFIEWAEVYDDLRGATHTELQRLFAQSKPIVWKMDWQGVKTVQKQFPESLSIVITPPNKNVSFLTARLKRRGADSLEEIQKRQKFSEKWMHHLHVYDFIVENKEGKLPETIKKAETIIRKKFFTT